MGLTNLRTGAGAALAALAVMAFTPGVAAARGACCRIAAGTPVQVELVETLSSASQKAGDTFAFRLAAPLLVDGMVVLPAGTRGQGEVIQSSGPGIGGKPAKLVLAAKYLEARGRRVPLEALQLSRPGRDRSRTSQLVGFSGMAFAPMRFVGIVVPGGQAEFHPGTVANAKVASAITLPPLRRASRHDLAAAAETDGPAKPETPAPIAIAAPPRGQGQVVFFRPKSLTGVGQWFKVREDGKELGKLSNGAYFVEAVRPGVHTYTARLEPELKDHLKLKIDAGETYFVEGALTGGLLLSAADLSPSTYDQFEKAAGKLKPAGAVEPREEHAEATGGAARPAAEIHASR